MPDEPRSAPRSRRPSIHDARRLLRGDAIGRELRGLIELPRLAAQSPWLVRKGRGDGTSVLVLPGRGADDVSTLPLRAYLRALGHAPEGWAIGTNDGNFARLVPLVSTLATELADRAGKPIPLIGQSMGGTVARQVALQRPSAVSRVITLGSPIMGPHAGQPLRCPLTVIYSRNDQIVPPRWALAPDDGSEVVEVSSTHFSMGVDPEVWSVVADRLARDVEEHHRSSPAGA